MDGFKPLGFCFCPVKHETVQRSTRVGGLYTLLLPFQLRLFAVVLVCHLAALTLTFSQVFSGLGPDDDLWTHSFSERLCESTGLTPSIHVKSEFFKFLTNLEEKSETSVLSNIPEEES